MSSKGRVFIGRLSSHASERDVESFFKGFGKIQEVNLKSGYGFVQFEDSRDADDAVYELNNQNLCGERVTVEHAKGIRRNQFNNGSGYRGGGGGYDSRSYGRSGGSSRYDGGGRSYGGRRDHDRSYDSRDDKYGNGGRKSRDFAPPSRSKYRVIVENLSSRCSKHDLKDYIRDIADVSYVEAHQRVRGEGIVDFASGRDMKAAIDKLDNTEICGKKIRIVEEGSSSCSRSVSKSPRYSRSRSRSRSTGRRGGRSFSRSRSPAYDD